MAAVRITSPDDPALAELAARLAEMAIELDHRPQWPAEQLRLCGEYGVYGWFLDAAWGGQAWNDEQVVRGYMALAAACLTTTFIITQRTGACRRIAGCNNEDLKRRVLPGLASGSVVAGPASVVAGPASVVAGPASVVAGLPTVPLGAGSGDPRTTGAGSGDPRTTWPFATVGISHLTTSRRHLARPVLTAERIPGGFRLDGMSPWVTGGAAADVLVLAATEIEGGATTDRQLLIAVPTSSPGLAVAEPLRLIGVSASATGPVHLEGVEVKDEWLIAGPMPNVMASGVGAGTVGIETSTPSGALAHAAIEYLAGESLVDLSVPQNPRLLGQVEIPGVSTYLHPLDAAHLLTIGFDGDQNRLNGQFQLQIFDVQNLAEPRLLHKLVPKFEAPGFTWTTAIHDHLAFNYFPEAGTLTVPVQYFATNPADHFSGFIAFSVSAASGFSELGRLDHSDLARLEHCEAPTGVLPAACSGGTYLEAAQPLRAVLAQLAGATYIYTLSNVGMKVSAAQTFGTAIATVPLPGGNGYWWIQ
jgi:hypothetical protein